MGTDAAMELAIAVAERLAGPVEPEPSIGVAAEQMARRTSSPALASAPVPSLAVRALGALDVTVNGAPLSRKSWGFAKARELLLYLLVHNEGRTREQIGAALWPEASSAQVRNNFHVALHLLRRGIGHAEWIRFERERYRLDVPGEIAFDARTFEDTVTAALRAGKRGALPIEDVRGALALYRGDFLDGESVGDWHLEQRDRLVRLREAAREALGTALVASERWDEAIAVLAQVVERDPLSERAYRALMVARARSGDRNGALREFRRLEEIFRREEMKPGRETLELHRRLQAGATV
jgi:DNA-binding SARP family transcriptional activator